MKVEILYALDSGPEAEKYRAVGNLPMPINRQEGENYVLRHVTLQPSGTETRTLWVPKRSTIHILEVDEEEADAEEGAAPEKAAE